MFNNIPIVSHVNATFVVLVCGVILFHCFNVPRLTPKNVHQRPTVVLLCGPHIQGAQGISCGRHLANHEVEVILFLPNFLKMQESVTREVDLFSRSNGKQVASIKGKTPTESFNMIKPKSTQDSLTPMLNVWTKMCLCCPVGTDVHR